MRIIGTIAQLISAAILLIAGALKFLNDPGSIELFSLLGMEPLGRFLIGGIEVMAALLILRRSTRATGALLAVGVMCGALIAHSTHVGFTPGNDGGKHMAMLATVLICSAYILVRDRKRLPIIGNTL